MKPSYKTLTTIAATGMTLYALHSALRLIPAVRVATFRLLPPATVYDDAYFGAWFGLLTAVTILTIVATLKQAKQEPKQPTVGYRRLTYVMAILLVAGIIWGWHQLKFAPYHMPNLYIPSVLRIPLLILSVVWLWMMTRQAGIGKVSKPLRVACIIGIILLCIPVLKMLISAIYYGSTGDVIMYRSWALSFWTKTIIPAILLIWYSIELYRTRSSK